MILCLDVGNSHLFGGLLEEGTMRLRFRHQTRVESTSDQLGVFLKCVLAENGFANDSISAIGISSVVPGINYSLRSACIKYFSIEPFMLKMGVKTGLDIKITHFGSDMVATAIAAVDNFPKRNIIVVDFGTATTFTVINQKHEVIGQVIQSGIKISMQALQTKTAQLPSVPIVNVPDVNGHNSISAIQSGLYYGQLGAVREIVTRLTAKHFSEADKEPVIIGTGGFARLFKEEGIFNEILPDLVFQGIHSALKLNIPK